MRQLVRMSALTCLICHESTEETRRHASRSPAKKARAEPAGNCGRTRLRDWLDGFICDVLAPLEIAALVAFGIYLVYEGWDNLWLTQRSQRGQITSVDFEPAHQVHLGHGGLLSVPDLWRIRIPDGTSSIEITHAPSDWEVAGMTVDTRYRIGRLSGDINFDHVNKPGWKAAQPEAHAEP